ncbi:MAG: dienelactone hydrolase family protein [Phycisphaerae bacterium]
MVCRVAIRSCELILLSLVFAAPALAAPPAMSTSQLADCFQARTITTSDAVERRYALFVPKSYDSGKAWPLVIFLHGSGECGTDGIAQTRVGLGPFVLKYRDKCPFIAVFPQGRGWFRNAEAKAVLEILAAVEQELSVDPGRIYLTGISMGGFGTWELATLRPDLFAAIVPICGGGPTEAAPNLARVPIWCFHGARDDRVPPKLSRDMVQAVRAAGGQPRFTEFPALGHLCWDQAYTTPGLFGWLLKQRRAAPPAGIRIALDRAWSPVPTRVWWFRVDAADPAVPRWQIDARITSVNEIQLRTTGITACAIVDEQCGPDVKDPLKVIWNDRVAFEGLWSPETVLKLPAGAVPTSAAATPPHEHAAAPASRPSTAPAARPAR